MLERSACADPAGFAGAVELAATAAPTLFRPAYSALLPTLCATPVELTSANVARGLLDSVATLIGPLVAAVLLKASGPEAVLAAAAGARGSRRSVRARGRARRQPPLRAAAAAGGPGWCASTMA